jgi:hypothetical protein
VGTTYSVIVTNDSDKRIAVRVVVDGDNATLNPVVVRSKSTRAIRGFMEEWSAEEDVDQEGCICYRTVSIESMFRATAPNPDADFDDQQIGTIMFEFFRVKFVRCTPGSHNSRRLSSTPGGPRGNAREGVLQTVRGDDRTLRSGSHSGSLRKPMADLRRPSGGFKITICNRDTT